MEIEVPQNEEIFADIKAVGSVIRQRANRGNINIKERERDVDPYIDKLGVKGREELESSNKERPYLMKVITPSWGLSGEKMPDGE